MRARIILSMLLVVTLAAAQKKESRPVAGKGVIFFGPSVAESDTLDAANSEALGDFSTYTGKVASFLQKHEIFYKYLSDRNIEIQYATVKHLSVNRDSVMFGTILTDGRHTPELLPFVHDDEELIHEIKAYFLIKD